MSVGVMAGVFTALYCGSPAAFINPGVTLAFSISGGDFSMLIPFRIAQVLGAFVAGVLLWLHFLPHWSETTAAGSKLACFCTGPAIRNDFLGRSILPVGVVPVTAVITEIRFGPIEKAGVHFLDGRQKEISPEEIGTYVSERENPENDKRVSAIKV